MFEIGKEQRDIKNAAREFAEGEFTDIAEEHDLKEIFPKDIWEKACELGFIGIFLDEEFNGAGMGMIDHVLLLEEFWRVDPGCGNILHTTLGAEFIQEYGNEAQKKKYLSSLPKGRAIIGTVIDRDDIYGGFAFGENKGKRHIIRGSSNFVINGDIADYIIITAKKNQGESEEGDNYRTFIIDRHWNGVITEPLTDKLGIRATDISSLNLVDVSVPEENIIGKKNEGLRHIDLFLDRLNIYSGAQALGLSQGCLERSISYARQRVQFGHPIGWFQLIQFKISDMISKIEAMRLLLYKSVTEYDRGIRDSKSLAMASALAKDVALQTVNEMMQIHGGYGYMKETGIERFYRDAQSLELFGYSREELKTQIAKEVLGRL
jgi:alkylation response protein AidB-like acyl-CoA dehydrogenase